MLSGDGSVEVSARPTFATAYATSGTRISAAFCRFAIAVFCSSEMLGSVTGMNSRSPSLSGGMNSLPMRMPTTTAPARTSIASISVAARCASAHSSDGRYSARSARISGFAPSSRTRPLISRVHNTGTSVIEIIVAASTAKVLVNASG